jgi:hypothetical protein
MTMHVESRPPAADLTGRWQLTHQVQRSALSRYVGMELEFDVELVQEGGTITGSGKKFVVDWQIAGRDEASTLSLEGLVDGDNVRLAVVERSPAHPGRDMAGEIIWKIAAPDYLIGSFRIDAAKSSGSSQARRRDA